MPCVSLCLATCLPISAISNVQYMLTLSLHAFDTDVVVSALKTNAD